MAAVGAGHHARSTRNASARQQPERLDAPTDEVKLNPLHLTHALLGSFYPFICTLSSLLPPETVKEDDDDAFRDLVERTMVGSSEEVKLRVDEPGTGIWMSEVLDRVQTQLFSLHATWRRKNKPIPGVFTTSTPPNILTLGYRLADERSTNFSMGGSGLAITNFFTNTSISSLSSAPSWSTLLSRIGPGPLITLLASPSTALFTPLPNACYLQISGFPLIDMKPRSTSIAGTTLASRTDNALASKGRRRRERTRKRGRKPSSHEDDEEAPAEVPTIHVSPPLESSRPNKRPRLGPSTSAPQLLAPEIPRLPSLLGSGRSPLRPTQSSSVLFAGEKRRVDGVELRAGHQKKRKVIKEIQRSPNEVVFVRNKMYHTRPSRTSAGKVAYRLSPKHILSRLPSLFPATPPDEIPSRQARHLLKYIFPRQFGLHSAFTSTQVAGAVRVDDDDRELEILKLGTVKTPKRLKGVLELAEKMIALSGKCKFRKLLDRHCPSKIMHNKLSDEDRSVILELMSEPRTQFSKADISIEVSHRSFVAPHGEADAGERVRAKPRFADYLCTPYQVESFVNAVVRETIPNDFWGSKANADLIFGYISDFFRLRRYETISVHTLVQKFRIADCDWLRPASASKERNGKQKPNEVEMGKRRELLQEFLYWFMDGFVMDLAKTAFAITESASYRNRTLYFRQDDWNAICKPLLENLGQTQFEKIPRDKVARMLKARKLGFSYVRLLPKDTGVRPIVNLRRRALQKGPRGVAELGRSINSLLENLFHVLNFEKNRNSALLGASVLGPNEIYDRLKTFKLSLLSGGKSMPKLYFVKVDVRACFDTIKQDKLLEIVDAILREDEYRIQRYGQVMPAAGRVSKKFAKKASPNQDHWHFPNLAAKLADPLRHAVLSDRVVYAKEERVEMLRLLREHVKSNLVKMGGRYFRQKDGIPQGSVLSGLLCSLFYGDMERTSLAFTQDPDALLLRYIDDFLFVTTKRPLAAQFLQTMDAGLPDYGCFIASEKRLTNFDISLNDAETVPPLRSKDFPWCGMVINTESLDVKADNGRYEEVEIADTLTVERYKKPGQAFIFKMLQAIKARSHIIYNDTNHNSSHSVYLNIYQSFLIVALKFHSYIKEWGADPRRRPAFFLGVIEQVIQFSHVAIRNRARTKAAQQLGGECKAQRAWIIWLGHHAFHRVLRKTPMLYGGILKSLAREVRDPSASKIQTRLTNVVHASSNDFAERPPWRR